MAQVRRRSFRVQPHTLRGLRPAAIIAQDQRVEIVQRVLGHRDIRSTLGYAELREAQARPPRDHADAVVDMLDLTAPRILRLDQRLG